MYFKCVKGKGVRHYKRLLGFKIQHPKCVCLETVLIYTRKKKIQMLFFFIFFDCLHLLIGLLEGSKLLALLFRYVLVRLVLHGNLIRIVSRKY
jgi:hypothetical protein